MQNFMDNCCVNGSFKAFSISFSGDKVDKVRFACPNHNCGRVFNWKRNLMRHLKYECGLQPRFKCPYCDYYGKLKGNVSKHLIRRHKTRKTYVVDLLQETPVFTWKRNLTSHLRYQCGQQPRFKCPYCDYMCKVKADIRKHIKNKHQNHDIYVIDIFQQWKVSQ
nr:PREDICTED: zinc finger X-chromosomal protein-like [Linepithema humile]